MTPKVNRSTSPRPPPITTIDASSYFANRRLLDFVDYLLLSYLARSSKLQQLINIQHLLKSSRLNGPKTPIKQSFNPLSQHTFLSRCLHFSPQSSPYYSLSPYQPVTLITHHSFRPPSNNPTQIDSSPVKTNAHQTASHAPISALQISVARVQHHAQ